MNKIIASGEEMTPEVGGLSLHLCKLYMWTLWGNRLGKTVLMLRMSCFKHYRMPPCVHVHLGRLQKTSCQKNISTFIVAIVRLYIEVRNRPKLIVVDTLGKTDLESSVLDAFQRFKGVLHLKVAFGVVVGLSGNGDPNLGYLAPHELYIYINNYQVSLDTTKW